MDETGIPEIWLGASQLEKERKGENDYKRRRGAREREVEKIREKKGRQEQEREKRKERDSFEGF